MKNDYKKEVILQLSSASAVIGTTFVSFANMGIGENDYKYVNKKYLLPSGGQTKNSFFSCDIIIHVNYFDLTTSLTVELAQLVLPNMIRINLFSGLLNHQSLVNSGSLDPLSNIISSDHSYNNQVIQLHNVPVFPNAQFGLIATQNEITLLDFSILIVRS